MDKSRWEEYNPNPDQTVHIRGRCKGKRIMHSDCVVRAFTLLFNMDWKDTYMKLALKGIEENDIFTVPGVFTKFLNKQPTPTATVDRPGDIRSSRKLTVAEIAELTQDNSLIFLCNCLHHVVVCKDGKYFDSWNSGSTAVRSLWTLKPEYQEKLRIS